MRWRIPTPLFLVLTLYATTALAGGYVEPSDVKIALELGEAKNVARLRNMWISAQPSAADFALAKEEGITTVINLRPHEEMSWDEQAAVKELGMTYLNLPIERNKPFSKAVFDMLDVVVADRSEEQMLIHCSSANRVGAWLATWLVREKGMRVDPSILVGRRAGMTNKALEDRVREFLLNPAP
jgi:uncharacterized protein (TIGR01244 family)